MGPFKKILVATDFSHHAAVALRLGSELAKLGDSALCLVHVQDLLLYSLPEGMPVYDATTLARLREDAAKRLSSLQAEALAMGVRQVETKLLDGRPFVEITRAARDWSADLIVVGTHGRSGFSRLFLGSVAERVVRSAPCPVIAVPLREEA